MINNVVVKSVTITDGPKIIQYFENLGVDTQGINGSFFELDGDFKIYYGVINNEFSYYKYSELNGEVKILSVSDILNQTKTYELW